MKKDMADLSIEVVQDTIELWQEDRGQGIPSICITVEQIDVLIGWLKEAKQEISESKKDDES